MLRAILNKSWEQHPTKKQLYGHLPHITKTIRIRQTRHAGHCWRSRDELISDVLLWTPSHDRAKAGRPARTYIQQLYKNTGYSPEDLSAAIDDREGWWERVSDIRADGVTWWWSLYRKRYLRKNKNIWKSLMLYIDLRPGQTCHSKDGRSCIFHWPVMGRDCVGELGWQYGTRLKSHSAVTNWCTGRGWPVNCMTVTSARWWSNMPFQRRWKLHIPLASYGKRLSGRKAII